MPTRTTLDRSEFMTSALMEGGVDIAPTVERFMRRAISAWAAEGLIKRPTSFGYAVARPLDDAAYEDITSNEPEKYVWFVGGWGEDWWRYAANAIRKIRSSIRNECDSLHTELNIEGTFEDIVESQAEDGTFPWGDFPWGGAAAEYVGNRLLLAAVSSLTQYEDDLAAALLAKVAGHELHKIEHPELHA